MSESGTYEVRVTGPDGRVLIWSGWALSHQGAADQVVQAVNLDPDHRIRWEDA